MRYPILTALSLFPLILVSACVAGCKRGDLAPASAAGPPCDAQRYAMVVGIKPEKIAYYRQLHADPWPAVLEQITRSHIRNYSIHMVELKPGEYYLFGYLEYTGDDFDADMKAMAADAETVRWWKETDPCQYPIETAGKGDNWTMMEEVFFHR